MAPKNTSTTAATRTEDGKTTHTVKLTEAEVRAEFEKLQERRERERARRQTPEFQARQKENNKKQREKRKAVLDAAEKLGLKLK